MDLFEQMGDHGHEQVLFCSDPGVGLRAIIAVHNTVAGPSLGGCRFYPYGTEAAALRDVLRLSRGMTYKAAVAGLDLGGGKSVIIGTREQRTEPLMRAFGRHVHSLGGRYLVAEDMNTTSREMDWIAQETPHVTGISPHRGGLGEPGPVTAWGVFHGVRGALEHHFGSPDVRGRRIAIQGLGSVGRGLAQHLHDHGARLLVTDIDAGRVREAVASLQAEGITGEAFYTADCDVLAPCAIGAVLHEGTIPVLRAPIVAGGANNILADEVADAERLADRGIAAAPDYVINAGGIMAMYAELRGWGLEWSMARAQEIHATVLAVFARAGQESVTPFAASEAIAEERLAALSHIGRFRI